MVFESLLDPVFSPLLRLPSLPAIAIVSFLMSLIITLIYRWMTDQSLMKDLKAEMKAFQKQIKELKKEPEKAMAMQKKAMETNMKYMMHSMKPTLITFLPIILIFGWLNANLAFEPITQNTDFTTTAIFQKGAAGTVTIKAPESFKVIGNQTQKIVNLQATWTLNGPTGEYFLEYDYAGEKQQKKLLITDTKDYAKAEERLKNSAFKSIKINNNPIKPFGNLSIFGWRPGWLGTYIIFSIAISMLLRKALKIY